MNSLPSSTGEPTLAITRRAALIGAAASSAALAVPAIAAVHPRMDVHERMQHHFDGLHAALAEWTPGEDPWEIRVRSDKSALWLNRVQEPAPESVALLSMALGAALCRRDPGAWRVVDMPDARVHLIVRDEGRPGVFRSVEHRFGSRE